MDECLEIRKLPPHVIYSLGQILDNGGTWKELMAKIPKDPGNNSELKYTVEHMRLIEAHGDKMNKSWTAILLDEWGTSGRVRPTLGTLRNILIKAELFRAADEISQLLNLTPPERPSSGPAAVIDTSVEQLHNDNFDTSLPHIPFHVLDLITNNFNDTPFNKVNGSFVGNRLGAGAFGTVYYAVLTEGRQVAVKKLGNDTLGFFRQFQTEIQTLSAYKHQNLLPLVAFSCDKDYCLVYEFMPNGSLLDRLADKPNNLTFETRVNIAIGASKGLLHLHTFRDNPLIHRDVKSANILLDAQLVPKLGDFGLVKMKPNTSESKMLTSTVFGTSAYMAPEAFRGDISVKMDVFSMGVVILELLTGLPPYDESREGCDLVTYVDDIVDESIEPLKDTNCLDWSTDMAEDMFKIARMCLGEKKRRPLILSVITSLENIENVSSL